MMYDLNSNRLVTGRVVFYSCIYIFLLTTASHLLVPRDTHAVDNINHDRLEYVTYLYGEDNPSTAHVSLRSFAVASLLYGATHTPRCTGTMVSPTVVMTAAHCQGITAGGIDPPIFINFRTYHNQDVWDYTDEEFECPTVWAQNSFWASNSDILLFECLPNGTTNPGDKYGFIDYLDYDLNSDGTDASLNMPYVNESVYSIWRNRVTDVGLDGNTMLYSWGEVNSIYTGGWFPVDCDTTVENHAVNSDVYVAGGGSGSLQFSYARGCKAVIGPTSTGGGHSRNATPMVEYLSGDVDDTPWVQENFDPYDPTPVSCDASLRTNTTDDNSDLLFDVLQELDSELSPRPYLSLNLDSRYRRSLWSIWDSTYVDASFINEKRDAIQKRAGILADKPVGSSSSWHSFASRELNLESNNDYDIRVEFERNSSSQRYAYLLAYITGCPYVYDYELADYNEYSANPKALTFGFSTDGCSGDPTLYLYAYGDYDVIVNRVSIAKKNSTTNAILFTMDNYDEREDWRNDFDAGRSLILGDGISGWGLIAYGNSTTMWNEECMNRAVPLKPNTTYRLKFLHRSKNDLGNNGYVLIRSQSAMEDGEGNVLYQEFDPVSYWRTFGTSPAYYFTTNDYEDYYISFGQKYGGSYYVDNVEIIEL